MEQILASLTDGNKKQPCLHPAFVNNICAVCKKSVDKFDIPTTVPFRYVHLDFSLTVDAIERLRGLDLQKLLNRKRLHLVLDLDHTLIHAIDKNNNKVKTTKNKKSANDDVYQILKGLTSVKLRPGARDFLNKVSQLFDLTIFTMAEEDYAKQIAKILESDKVRFSSVISGEYRSKVDGKSLDIVLSHQQVVLIVDDKDEVWVTEDRGNVIKIKPYIFFKEDGSVSDDNDQELARVWSILKTIHTKFFHKKNENYYDSKDVRQLVRKI